MVGGGDTALLSVLATVGQRAAMQGMESAESLPAGRWIAGVDDDATAAGDLNG